MKKHLGSDFFEDAKQEDNGDYAVNANDINIGYAQMNERGNTGFESSNDDSASSGANHS